jgi:hypothetical protein
LIREANSVSRSVASLQKALSLAMSLHRAIIRQGTSIIDKQAIRTMRSHRVVVLSQGPDLQLFLHPGVLSRLARWLVDALRDRLPGTAIRGKKGRKSLPFIVACLNESAGTYIVVGVMAALDFGDIRKKYGPRFLFDIFPLTKLPRAANSGWPSWMPGNGVMHARNSVLGIRVSLRLNKRT